MVSRSSSEQRSPSPRLTSTVFIYPMNALAIDQAERLAKIIWNNMKLKGSVTAGLFVGQSEREPRLVMGPDSIITNKETLRLKTLAGHLCCVGTSATLESDEEKERPKNKVIVYLIQPIDFLARLAGFEPATYGLEVRCSIQLSYRRTVGLGNTHLCGVQVVCKLTR